jgi:hypothetical protein
MINIMDESLVLEKAFVFQCRAEGCEEPGTVLQVRVCEVLSKEARVFTWPSAVVLSTFLVARPEVVRRKRVLELGAGTGLPSIVAALLGAEHCLVTERNEAETLRNIQRSVALNALRPSPTGDIVVEGAVEGSTECIEVCALSWPLLPPTPPVRCAKDSIDAGRSPSRPDAFTPDPPVPGRPRRRNAIHPGSDAAAAVRHAAAAFRSKRTREQCGEVGVEAEPVAADGDGDGSVLSAVAAGVFGSSGRGCQSTARPAGPSIYTRSSGMHVVLAADVLYSSEHFDDVLRTMATIIDAGAKGGARDTGGSVAEGEGCVVYCCYQERSTHRTLVPFLDKHGLCAEQIPLSTFMHACHAEGMTQLEKLEQLSLDGGAPADPNACRKKGRLDGSAAGACTGGEEEVKGEVSMKCYDNIFLLKISRLRPPSGC